MFVSLQAPRCTCVHSCSMFAPFVSAGYLQMSLLWCTATAVVSFPVWTHFFIAATSQCLSAMKCRRAWACLTVASVQYVTENKNQKKSLIIFWWGKNLTEESLKCAYGDSSDVSCKVVVNNWHVFMFFRQSLCMLMLCANTYVNTLVKLDWAYFAQMPSSCCHVKGDADKEG